MFTRALRIWATTIALGAAAAATQATAQSAPPANRLALVVGEAAYNGDVLPTASADAALVARSLAGNGFDVTELHDLATADLASQYQAFVAKVAAAPPGAAVTVYFGGLGVTVGCDDYLLPVDAQIATEADVPRIALSMTRVMRDLAQTQSQLRLVMLDGARPVPGSVSAVAFPRGLIPLDPPAATTFALSAEIHDFESPPKPGDANDAYAAAFVTAAQLPLTDVESVMRETRVIAHQATAGAQTPWQETNPSEPPFTFPLNPDPAQVQAAVATLPNSTSPIADLDPESAYWAAVWRNDVSDYQAYLAAFGASATPERKTIIENLIALLQQPNPQCQASAPPAPPPTIIAGPGCPDGFYAQGGFDEAYCAPLAPPPALVCPPGFASISDRRRHGLRALHSAAGPRLPAALPPDRPTLLRARHPAALLPPGLPSGLARRLDDVRAQWSAAADLPLRDSSGVERRRLCLRRQPAAADSVPQRAVELAQRPVGLPAAAAAVVPDRRDPAMDQRQGELRRIPPARRADALPARLPAVAGRSGLHPGARPCADADVSAADLQDADPDVDVAEVDASADR